MSAETPDSGRTRDPESGVSASVSVSSERGSASAPDAPRGGRAASAESRASRLFKAFLPFLLLGLLLATDLLVCPVRYALGVPCPGCGLTRATLALLHGDLAEAHHFHPLVLVLLPMVVWTIGRSGLVSAGLVSRDAFDPLDKLPTWFWWAFLVIFVGTWVARLAGALGGHPDGIHLEAGALLRLFHWLTG